MVLIDSYLEPLSIGDIVTDEGSLGYDNWWYGRVYLDDEGEYRVDWFNEGISVELSSIPCVAKVTGFTESDLVREGYLCV